MRTRIAIALSISVALITIHLGQVEATPRKQVRERAAPVYGAGFIKGQRGLINKAGIRDAALSCMSSHLRRMRPAGYWTVAGWNRIDPSSLKLKRVELRKDTHDTRGYRLRRNEKVFRATYTALQSDRQGKKKQIKLYVESEMNLSKRLPRFEFRYATPWQGRARTLPFGVPDPTTNSWVD